MQKIKPYEITSEFYSFLMKDIDYNLWAEYLKDLIRENIDKCDLALEIASGNGVLASFLSKKIEAAIILSDLSKQMLMRSPRKFGKVQCDMRALPFGTEFDLIFSAFDSVNYLTKENDVIIFFNEISKILSRDGIFLFDVSLENNSLNNVDLLNRSEKFGKYQFQQISYYDEATRIHTNEFIIKSDEKIYKEKHEQKIYSFFDYFAFFEKTDLFVSACYDAFTFEDASPESERAQFVVRKKNDTRI